MDLELEINWYISAIGSIFGFHWYISIGQNAWCYRPQ